MSQVKILKKGSKTPDKETTDKAINNTVQKDNQQKEATNSSLGSFSMNGRTIQGQLALDRLFDKYKDVDLSERGMYDVANKAILEGQKVIYNPANNTIQVLDESGNDITGNYTKIKASPNDSVFKRTWDATFKNRADSFKRSGQYLSSIDMNTPEEPKEPIESKYKWERGNNDWWTNTKDGKSIDFEDVLNRDRWNTVINNIDNIYNSKDIKDIMNDKEYDMSAWSNNVTELERLRNLYNEIGDTPEVRQQYLDNLKQRLISGNLTSGDYDLLGLMGFKRPDTQNTNNNEQNNEYKIPEGWTGNTDAAKNAGVIIVHNEDGTWSVTGSDNYTKNTWYNKGLKFLEGTPFEDGFIIDGILRSKEDILENPDSYRDKIGNFMALGNSNGWNDWYDRANASGVRFVGDRIWENKDNNYYGAYTNYNIDTQYSPDLWQYLKKNKISNTGISDVSNLFDLTNKKGVKVYSYLDPSKRNYAGIYIPQYVIKDTDGYLRYSSDNIDDIAKKLGVQLSKYPQTTSNLIINPYEDVRGIKMALTKQFGNPNQRASLGRDKNGNYYIYRGDQIDPIQLTGYGTSRDQETMHKIMQYIRGEVPWTWKDLESLRVKGTPLTPVDTASTIAYKKSGGKIDWDKIPKFLFGGAMDRASANKVESNKISESAKDITKDHKINGSDGGITQAEQNQLIAAGLDLSGVVASLFGPVGNIAGAATGAAGSIMRYKADKAQGDESGVKNAGWELAANLGLDLISAIPVAGVIAKSAKATKALNSIRKVAKPLLTIATTAGMTSMVSPLKKIISGEELTSQDLVDLGKGLSSGILFGRSAAKSVKKGVGARLLAQDAKKTAIQSKTTVNVGDKKITKTRQELEDLIDSTNGSRKEMIDQIKSEAKSLGVDLSDAGAKKALNDFGINWTGKTKEGWSIKHPFSRGKVIDRTGSLPELSDGRSTLGYAWRDMLGGFGNGKVDATIASTTPLSVLRSVTPGFSGNSSKNFYLNELMYRNPYLFNEVKFKEAQFPFGLRNYRYNRGIVSTQEFLPESYYENEARKAIISNISKAFPSTRPIKISSLLPEKQLTILNKSFPSNYLSTRPLNTNTSDIEELLNSIHGLKQGGSIPKYVEGGPWGKGLEINKNRVKDLFSNIAGNIASNKSWREEKASIDALKKRRFISPILVGERFSTTPIERKYESNIEPYRKIKFNNSDNRENIAGNLQVADRIAQFNNQKEAEISNLINNWNAKNVDRINKQRALDADMANQSSNYYAQLESQKLARKSLKTQSDFGRWNEMYYQWRQEDKDRSNSLANLIYQHNYNNLKTNYENAVNTELQKKWKAAYDADTRANKGDLATWVRLNKAQEYSDWINSEDFKKRYNKLTEDINLAARKSLYTKSPLFKKGGKMNDERFALESNKDAKKAIRQAANHLNKLLQQLLK